jgi:Zn finger protein HypA/HybF involved in hydrogenase expression
MNVRESLNTIEIQTLLNRTSEGFSLSPKGKSAIEATIADNKNFGVMAVKCQNCGIILSSNVVANGCPNCNNTNMKANLSQDDII